MRIGKPESDEKGFVRFEDIGIVNQDGLEIDWISTKDLFMNKQDMEVIVL